MHLCKCKGKMAELHVQDFKGEPCTNSRATCNGFHGHLLCCIWLFEVINSSWFNFTTRQVTCHRCPTLNHRNVIVICKRRDCVEIYRFDHKNE